MFSKYSSDYIIVSLLLIYVTITIGTFINTMFKVSEKISKLKET